MTNFIPQYEPLILDKYIKDVSDQIKSGWIGPSKAVEDFEKKICEITGAKYAISTTSGTVAIMLALKSFNLPNDSSVVFPDYTFLAGANATKFLGYDVILKDISKITLCLNPFGFENWLLEQNKIPNVVFFVNHNGYVGADRFKIKKICSKYNIKMIEDSSQALGMFDKNNIHAGRFGDVGIFSFSVPKIVTTGQGGVIITDNDEIAKQCMRIRDHGGDNWKKTKTHLNIGVNFKFNDILASYGLSQLNSLDVLLNKRKEVFDNYRKYLKFNNLIDFNYESTWMVIFKSKNADLIVDALSKNNIKAEKYYKPIHLNPPYYQDDSEFPNSMDLYNKLVYLPSSLGLTEREIKRISNIVNEIEINN